MSYFQSENYYKLISCLKSIKVYQTTYADLKLISIESTNLIKKYFSCRNLIIDPEINKFKNAINTEELKKISGLNKKAIFTELRFHKDITDIELKLSGKNIYKSDYYNILVNTGKAEKELYNAISSSKKRQIKSSVKNNLKVIIVDNEKDVIDFYNILHNHYKKKVKKPVYPLDFFLSFFREKENGFIFIAKYNEKVIGGMFAPVFENEIIYEWYIAAEDIEYKAKGIYPSVLITWEVIKFASINGFKTFDFMGAGPVDKDYGVRQFKLQFGGELIKTARIRLIHKPFLFKIGEIAIQLGFGNLA